MSQFLQPQARIFQDRMSSPSRHLESPWFARSGTNSPDCFLAGAESVSPKKMRSDHAKELTRADELGAPPEAREVALLGTLSCAAET
jgi:hypothetical protein